MVETIITDIVKAIEGKKTAAVEAAKSKAGQATKDLDAAAARGKHAPGTIVKAAQDVAVDVSGETVDSVREVAIKAGQELARVPNSLPQKLFSEAQLELSQQLEVMVAFLSGCFQAEDEVIRMQTLLQAKTGMPLTSSDKRLLSTWWDTVWQTMKDLKDRQRSIDRFDSPPTQQILSRLFQPESVDPAAINHQLQALSDKSDVTATADLKQSLAALKDVLNAINGLALTVIKDFVRGLADVSHASGTSASAFEEVTVSQQTAV